MDSLVTDPYLRSRRSMRVREHPTEGAYGPRPPAYGSPGPTSEVKHAPHVDEDRAQILGHLKNVE